MSLRTPGVSTLFPSGQARQQYQRDWGNYASSTTLPNASGNALSAAHFTLEVGDVAEVTGVGRWVCASIGTAGGADAWWYQEPPPGFVNVMAYGAKGDSVTNDAAAFQAAGNVAMAVGGGVWVPQAPVGLGYRIATEVYWPAPAPPAAGAAQAFMLHGAGRSRIICDTGAGASVFVWSGFNSVDVRELMFVGISGRLIDCYSALNIPVNNGANVQDCTFKGVGAAGPGVVICNGSDFTMHDVGFWGTYCAIAVVNGILWSRMDFERVTFNDIAILDGSTAVSKVGGGAFQGVPAAWIRAGTVGPSVGGFAQSTFRAVSCWFDENAASAIRVLATTNQLYAALIEDCQISTGSILTNGQAALEFQNIAKLDIVRTTIRELFGGGSLQKDAISCVNVERTTLDAVRTATIATDANLIRFDASCLELIMRRMKETADYRTLTIPTTLLLVGEEQAFSNVQAAGYALAQRDIGNVVNATGAGAQAFTLPDLSSALLTGHELLLTIQCEGVATAVTITPGGTSQINGAGVGVPYVVAVGMTRVVLSSRDGLNWFAW